MNIKIIKQASLILLFMIIVYGISEAIGDVTSSNATSTQNNTSGGNTSIQGYEATTNNTYQSGSSNDTTNTTNNSTNNKSFPPSANAPAMQTYSQKSCIIGLSGGFTFIGFSTSIGTYVEDKNCELRLKAELLDRFQMKIASISLLCTDPLIFEAMLTSGTPCPVLHEGKSLIGDEAMKVILERRAKEKVKVSAGKRSMSWNEKPIPSGNINDVK